MQPHMKGPQEWTLMRNLVELQSATKGSQNPHLPISQPFRPLTNVTRKVPGTSYSEINLDGVLSEDFARVAGYRRLKVAAASQELSGERDMCPDLAMPS